jgi:hypothetical protein
VERKSVGGRDPDRTSSRPQATGCSRGEQLLPRLVRDELRLIQTSSRRKHLSICRRGRWSLRSATPQCGQLGGKISFIDPLLKPTIREDRWRWSSTRTSYEYLLLDAASPCRRFRARRGHGRRPKPETRDLLRTSLNSLGWFPETTAKPETVAGLESPSPDQTVVEGKMHPGFQMPEVPVNEWNVMCSWVTLPVLWPTSSMLRFESRTISRAGQPATW